MLWDIARAQEATVQAHVSFINKCESFFAQAFHTILQVLVRSVHVCSRHYSLIVPALHNGIEAGGTGRSCFPCITRDLLVVLPCASCSVLRQVLPTDCAFPAHRTTWRQVRLISRAFLQCIMYNSQRQVLPVDRGFLVVYMCCGRCYPFITLPCTAYVKLWRAQPIERAFRRNTTHGRGCHSSIVPSPSTRS